MERMILRISGVLQRRRKSLQAFWKRYPVRGYGLSGHPEAIQGIFSSQVRFDGV
jgi:hypothetical protein